MLPVSTPHVAPVRPTALVTGASSGIGLAGVTALGADLARDGVSAERVARTVLRAVQADAPVPTYAVGSGAPAVFALRRALPAAVVERVVARRFGLGPRGVRA